MRIYVTVSMPSMLDYTITCNYAQRLDCMLYEICSKTTYYITYNIYHILYTVYYIPYIIYYKLLMRYTIYHILHTVYCIPYTIKGISTLYIIYHIPYTIYCIMYTFVVDDVEVVVVEDRDLPEGGAA